METFLFHRSSKNIRGLKGEGLVREMETLIDVRLKIRDSSLKGEGLVREMETVTMPM